MLKVGTPIGDSIDCMLSPGEQSPRKEVGLLGPVSKIRRYSRYNNATTVAQGAGGDSGGYRLSFYKNCGVFVVDS